MKLAVFGRKPSKENYPLVQEWLTAFQEEGFMTYCYAPFFNALHQSIESNDNASFFTTVDELPDDIDTIVSIGGDGTLLSSILLVRDRKIPIMGINTGRMGFLASVNKTAIRQTIQDLKHGNYVLETRTLIQIEQPTKLFHNDSFALNEFTIHKRDTSSMITIHAYLNGEFLNSYWVDGLIVATPTGSTGYSLSCGGPIVAPGSGNFVITPVAPHNLNVRPIIVPDDSVLEFQVEGRSADFLCTLDSRYATITPDDRLLVKKNNFGVNLLRFKDYNFLDTLRTKLNWGLDKRNQV